MTRSHFKGWQWNKLNHLAITAIAVLMIQGWSAPASAQVSCVTQNGSSVSIRNGGSTPVVANQQITCTGSGSISTSFTTSQRNDAASLTLNNGVTLNGPDSSTSPINFGVATVTIEQGATVRGATTISAGTGATIINRGTISSTNGTAFDYFNSSASNKTILNSGTIEGNVNFFDGNDTFTLENGGRVSNGVVDGGAGTNRLVLGGASGRDTFDASSIGSGGTYRNFQGFEKSGNGTWVLTGSGNQAWNVTGGALMGTTSSIQGDIQTSSQTSLTFDQNSDGQYRGVVSGSGALIKSGSGVVTLSGDNSYSGGTQINGGALAVDANNRLGAQGAPVTFNGGALIFNSSFDTARPMNFQNGGGTIDTNGNTAALGGVLSGSGDFTKNGGGLLVLSGNNTFSGQTTVAGGQLRVDSSLAGRVLVRAGATLSGRGSVGSVDNSGVVGISPNTGIGTFRVNGNYTQTQDGTLAVRIDPNGSADRLAVSGTANLNGNLQVLPNTGNYVVGTSYDVLTAQAVSGRFSALNVANSDRLGGIGVGVNYLSDRVNLTLLSRQQVVQQQQEVSTTQQQEVAREVAPAVERSATRLITASIATRIASIINPSTFFRAPLISRPPVVAPTAPSVPMPTITPPTTPAPGSSITPPAGGLGTPGGTAPGSTPSGGQRPQDQGSLMPTGLAAGEEASGLKGLSAWTDLGLSLLDNADREAKYNGIHKSALLGVDYRFDDTLVAGIAVAPEATDINLKSVDGNRQSMGATLSTYVGYKIDDTFSATAMAGYGRIFTFSRQPLSGTWVKDHYAANRYFGQVGINGAFLLEEATRLTPGISYTHSMEASEGHYSNDGANVNLPATRLGTMRFSAQIDHAITNNLVPFVNAALDRDLISSSGGGTRTGYALGAGVQAPVDDNLTLGAAATSSFGRAAQSETQFSVNLRYSW